MSSLVTQMIVTEKYGLRLNTAQIAEVLGITKAAVLNKVSDGTMPIKTYMDAGKRWADYRDVAEHIDGCRARAALASA